MSELSLQQRKQLVALKSRARRLDIHTPDTDKLLMQALRHGKGYHRRLIKKASDNFWFDIPQADGKPLIANIKRIDVNKFQLYILFDKHLGIEPRTFGKGGIQNPHPLTVTNALNDLFSVAFSTERERPPEEKPEDLPLFKVLEKEAVPA